MADSIVWTDLVEPATASAVAGAKMGRLSELLHAGAQVPVGFTVTAQAYHRHCSQVGLDARVDSLLADLDPRVDPLQVEATSRSIRSAFETTPLAAELERALLEAYEELSLRCGDVNVPTAVRSSACGEDAHDASFAGIFDSYLGVAGAGRVLDAVRSCWGSAFSTRALHYRLRRGLDHRQMPIAVGVMDLVHARASGVAFSMHPVTGNRDRAVIEGNWGWGEAVAQGLVTPDHIEVDKSDGRVLRYDIAQKRVVSAFDYAAGRVVEAPMPVRLVGRRVLDDEQVAAVLEAVTRIERHFGYPVDVEWVLSRHRRSGEPVHVVQARPITVDPAAAPSVWDPMAMITKHAFGGTD